MTFLIKGTDVPLQDIGLQNANFWQPLKNTQG